MNWRGGEEDIRRGDVIYKSAVKEYLTLARNVNPLYLLFLPFTPFLPE